MIHIYPLNDFKEHVLTTDCWCRPQVDEDEDDDEIVVHNSMDKREEYENGRLLS